MISVAMCTYNGERFIKEQLESIIHQTLQPDELIICDDCSKDGTEAKIKSILSQWTGSWKFVRNETNLGYKKNFQKAISLCSGDIIFLSDQDDVWMPEKIQKVMKVFHDNPKCTLVFHDAVIVDSNLKTIYSSFWENLGFNSARFIKKDYGILLDHNVLQGSASTFKKSLFLNSLPFPDAAVHDEWLMLNAVMQGETIFPINEKLLLYRQSNQNAIGAVKLSLYDRIIKWSKTLHQAGNMHYKELNRRMNVWKALSEKYGNHISLNGRYLSDIYTFYDNRINCIKRHKVSILIDLCSYFKNYNGNVYAARNFIKDFLALIVYL